MKRNKTTIMLLICGWLALSAYPFVDGAEINARDNLVQILENSNDDTVVQLSNSLRQGKAILVFVRSVDW